MYVLFDSCLEILSGMIWCQWDIWCVVLYDDNGDCWVALYYYNGIFRCIMTMAVVVVCW